MVRFKSIPYALNIMQKKLNRRNEIMDIAVKLLSERGYQNTSMLAIAQKANASKETLYGWFKNKRGLFEQIIQRNTDLIKIALQDQLDKDASIEAVLSVFGYELREMLLSDEAISINHAAISESPLDSTLADALLAKGRNATLPLLINYFDQKINQGVLVKEDPALMAEMFLGLLLRDKQILRLLGQIQKPSKSENKKQSIYATDLLLRLYSKD